MKQVEQNTQHPPWPSAHMRSHTYTFKNADGGCTTKALKAIIWQVPELAHTSPNAVMTLKNSVLMGGGISLHDLGQTIPISMIHICPSPPPSLRWTHSTESSASGCMEALTLLPGYLLTLHMTLAKSLVPCTGSLGPMGQRAARPEGAHSTTTHIHTCCLPVGALGLGRTIICGSKQLVRKDTDAR